MSANDLRFDSSMPVWMVISAALLLSTFFLWKEVKRNHGYRVVRIVAQVIISISLALLLLRPSIKTEKTMGSAMLLTRGYTKNTADSLVSNFGLRAIRAFDAEPFKDSETLTSWHALSKDADDIQFVLGEGIPLASLNEYVIQFKHIEGDLPTGITQLTIHSLKKNQLNFIQGEVNSNESSILKLVGPNGAEDSVQLKGETHEAFSLSLFAKQEGKFIYQLTREVNGRVIESENLPIEVLPKRKLNILLLQQYPTFEVRNLKNFLGEKGHAVTVRYQTSKNIYQYEYLNQEKQVFAKLNSQILNDLDLLIVTPEAVNDLNSSEFQILEKAIKEGLGVLLLVNQPLKKGGTIFSFTLFAANSDTVSITSPQWKEKLTLHAVPLRMKSMPGVTGLFHDKNDNLLSGYTSHGLGKVGFQILNETYPLLLAGKLQEYANIWSPLIEEVSRRQQENFKYKITSPFPHFIDQPIHFEIVATLNAPEVYYDSIRIALQEDVSVRQLWHGTIWADVPGWHQFTTQDSTTFSFYVSDENEWNALNKMNQAHENKMHNTNEASLRNATGTEYTPVPPLLFFILFVVASGTLWLAAKV